MAATRSNNAMRRTGTATGAGRKAAARPKAKAASGKALRLAGVGSEAVMRSTGRAWEEWLKVLDRAGAKAMAHKDIALLLSRRFRVPDWWSQMVTVGYEQARGLRAVNQRADGFAANASRTIATDLDRLYAAWNEPRQRSKWLPEAPIEVRRASDGKSMRITWTANDSRVEVGFFAAGKGKSRVQVGHAKLASAAAVKRQKAFWADALVRLKAYLETPR